VDSRHLASFEEVVSFLRETYNWFADLIADRRAEEELPTKVEPIGGFGVQLINHWGSQVEVGVGRDIWFLCRCRPKPTRGFSDNPQMVGWLVFYLDGWHYTSLDSLSLVPRDACISALKRWLEQNEFPVSRTSSDQSHE
jgi:hypothetical protein